MGMWNSSNEDGMNGAFQIPLKSCGHKVLANCIVSDGVNAPVGYAGWEHVSVHVVEYSLQRTPTWNEMCQVKDIFWGPEECVVQFHPPESEYVRNHPHVLHLWRWIVGGFPIPPSLLVGIKGLGTITE